MADRQRVVVIGHGMVAARLLDELDRRAPRALDVTVLGAEPYEPYNRVLLSDVVAGRTDLAALTLPAAPDWCTVLRGVAAAWVDRKRRVVGDDQGGEHPYETVVFATGARASIPPISGLANADGDLPGVRALRNVDDCRDLVAAASRGIRTVVLGGGLLGVEVASGLRRRGVPVELIHYGPHLMDRQLDGTSAAVLAAGLRDLGVVVHTDAEATEVIRESGAVTAVRLSSGLQVAAEQIVLATGATPEDGLAAAAGIACDRGILVGRDLRSPNDPTIAAIGDCARPPEGQLGLLEPGLRQADRLAADLLGAVAQAADSTEQVVRLKAAGLDAVVLGEGIDDLGDLALTPVDGPRTISLIDPQGRRCIQVVVNGGRITGAVCIGDAVIAAELTQTYLLPGGFAGDPAHLLVAPLTGQTARADSPTAMPGDATVCRCNGVTKRAVVQAYTAGDRSVAEVAARTRCTTGCGGCRPLVEGLLDWMAKADPDGPEVFPPETFPERDRNTPSLASTSPTRRDQ